MEKTYKRVPFDIELAKDITYGKVEGRIYFETTLADESKTYTWIIKSIHDLKNEDDPYYVISECDNQEYIEYMNTKGYIPQQLVYAVIELPEEVQKQDSFTKKLHDTAEVLATPKPKFKPFDKVLVRDCEEDEWQCNLFSHLNVTGSFRTIGGDWMYCIPYEGNEYLIGTTDKPKEE